MLSSMGAAQHEALFYDCSVTLRRLIPLLATLVALTGVVAACGGAGAASLPSGVLAEVNGEPVTRAQLDRVLEQVEAGYKANKKTMPSAGSAEYDQIRTNALNYLVQRVEYTQQAKDLGLKASDAELDKRIAQVKKQYFQGNEKKYEDFLAKQKFTEAEYRDILRVQLLGEKIFEKVTNDVKVTDADIEAEYRQNIDQYTTQESREVRHILVADKATAERVYKQLKSGASFAVLAKKFSSDTSTKNKGGKLVAVKGQTVPEFEKAAFDLKAGELSEPVHSQYGWHLIEPIGPVKPKKVTPLKDVEKAIRQTLTDSRRQTAAGEWQAAMTKDYEKKIKYAKGFEPPPAETAPTGTSPLPGG
jgi:parvulin-like peptidyl-prolyl isomerase